MGEKIRHEFDDCVRRGKIKKFPGAKTLSGKEISVAENDLLVACEGLKNNQWKWSTIQAYYSMFHTSRALLYSEGYREKSHYCLRIALEILFVGQGRIDEKFIDAFQSAKIMRENADYEENFSESGAHKLVNIAREFLDEARKILGKT